MFGKIFTPKKTNNEQDLPPEQPTAQAQNQQFANPSQDNNSQQSYDAEQNTNAQQGSSTTQQAQGQVQSDQSQYDYSQQQSGENGQNNSSGQQAQGQESSSSEQTSQNQQGQTSQSQSNHTNETNANTSTGKVDMSALSHLDPKATQVLTHAQEETRRIHQQYIEPDQILFGLLYDEDIYKLLEEFQVDGGKLSKELQAKEKMGTYKGQPILSKSSQQVFDQAYRDAKMRGSNFVSPDDLLIILFSPSYPTAKYLQEKGLKKELLVEKIAKNPNSNYAKRGVLDKFGIDLTEEAREGRLDPVAGRDKEVDRIEHILLRRTKNNPIIIGETGVGKTAIVEGLAQKIVAGQVPKDLQDKRLFQLDVASLVAGASHRGEFEERMRAVINEVLGSNNRIILFIDEIHALMGTGEGEGMNAANIIKPHLARGHFQLIGATTTTEYRKNFEKDKAFERRFQPVTAEEPSDENAVLMLKVLRPKYEKFHHVTIPDDALKESVKLAKKYIGERFLPDKAVDLLDEACSEVKLQMDAGRRGENQVKKADIEKVVSAWTGIPITKLTEDESEKLLKLEDRIHKRLIDQEEAVVAVSEAVRRGRIGLASGTRPIASFVFLGPTGVGKTELAKTLAELLFGRDDSMARLDMSEFMEKHEVAKLIGAPPGYVGYEEGGVLTEAVRKKPYSIVLLDEIEKAHPDVFNILLQLLEDGRLTDNKGNVISFKNTIVICTSNIGSSLIQQQLNSQDPKAKKTPEEYNKAYKQLEVVVREELIKFFRPELLNRFDEVVVFKPLQPEHMAGIARLGISKTAGLLKEQGFGLQITEKAIAKLAKDGYDPVYGARPLRRLIQTAIENPIALAIISKKFVVGDTIVIDYSDDTNEFIFTKGGAGQIKADALDDEQFKLILLKIAKPESIINESDRNIFVNLHDKTVNASTTGNKTASLILSVNAATTKAEIQEIRKQLEESKMQGDDLAKEILSLAEGIAQQNAVANKQKKIFLQIVNPTLINSAEKKVQFTQLHDKLVEVSSQNPIAVAILAITNDTQPENINKIMEDLKKAKDQEDELATEILSVVNTEISEQAEQEHEAEPSTKFKKTLQQVINPLYTASPENKEKFTKLYDKISDANHQNHPLAGSILAVNDLTSDTDIVELKNQLQQAKDQGDQLAAEILDTIESAIKYEGVGQLKNTALFISNPLMAKTPHEREDFTSLHDKISQASQNGNQLAVSILNVSESTTDDEIIKLKESLEQAEAQKDEIAILVLNTAKQTTAIPDSENSQTIQSSPNNQQPNQNQTDSSQSVGNQTQTIPPQQQNVVSYPAPQQPFQQSPMQQMPMQQQGAAIYQNTVNQNQSMPVEQPPVNQYTQQPPVAGNNQMNPPGSYAMNQPGSNNYVSPVQNPSQQVIEPVQPGPVLQSPFQSSQYNSPVTGQVVNEFLSNISGIGITTNPTLKSEE
jgi:ATP-dependent Clp protease ATP-binding subunit ClpC